MRTVEDQSGGSSHLCPLQLLFHLVEGKVAADFNRHHQNMSSARKIYTYSLSHFISQWMFGADPQNAMMKGSLRVAANASIYDLPYKGRELKHFRGKKNLSSIPV